VGGMMVKVKKTTQLRAVMAALLDGAAISRESDFSAYGWPYKGGKIVMLQSRISDLRKLGWPILTVRNSAWNYCKYLFVGAERRTEAGRDER